MNDDDEAYSFSKYSLNMKVGTKFENVVDFRRALNHYAIINEFDYFIQKSDQTRFTARCENIDCKWRIYASIMQDGITFEVRKIEEGHTYAIREKIMTRFDKKRTMVKKWNGALVPIAKNHLNNICNKNLGFDQSETSTSKRSRGKNTKSREPIQRISGASLEIVMKLDSIVMNVELQGGITFAQRIDSKGVSLTRNHDEIDEIFGVLLFLRTDCREP
ncbi:hypothetical protein L2E82_27853 [Cichorium intybus]|uniref:Uncharacterized protein n=1 Tax=Cichorium intybus TaxID=13427 RepID=A0ACB9CUF4_CICIN|nr:hypothetical protein L2E82_27853 [Cichorium intybus]